MNDLLKKFKSTKILGICGNALIAIATFLPVASASVFSITKQSSFIEEGGDGIIVLLLAIISLLLIFADKISKTIPFFGKLKNPKYTLIPTAICAIILIIFASKVISQPNIQVLGVSTESHLEFGFWIMFLGVVISACYPILYKGEK